MFVLSVLAAAVSAVLAALSDVVQHKAVFASTGRADVSLSGTAGLVRNRLWLFGFLLIVIAFAFQAVGLGVGQVVTVQTVLVSMLVWVLVFAVVIEGVKLTKLEYVGSLLVVVGLVVFVLFVSPRQGPPVVRSAGWAVASATTLVVCAALIAVGRRLSPGPAAALMGTAGGLINGLNAGLVATALIVLAHDGIAGLLANWILYAAVVALLLGVLFPVWAFQVGPVTASVPPLVVFNPALGTLLGIWLLDERVHETVLDIVLVALAWVLMLIGILVLSRSKVIATEFAEDAEEVTEAAEEVIEAVEEIAEGE